MIESKALMACEVHAKDGDIGKVRDVYFDDEEWTVRYLVVDTGGWMNGRRVLVSPVSVLGADADARHLDVSLSQQQVRTSPDVDTDKPISRQQESQFMGYYGYSPYWTGDYVWGLGIFPAAAPIVPTAVPAELGRARRDDAIARELRERARRERENADHHLRSAREVAGYHVRATDGDIGHVEQFLIGPRSWSIEFLVIDTRNWLPGRHVLVAPEWIERISWSERAARVALTRQAIEDSPPYEGGDVAPEVRAELHRRFGRPEQHHARP